jgi:hypothetical protein
LRGISRATRATDARPARLAARNGFRRSRHSSSVLLVKPATKPRASSLLPLLARLLPAGKICPSSLPGVRAPDKLSPPPLEPVDRSSFFFIFN